MASVSWASILSASASAGRLVRYAADAARPS
jgi:hypothetical protein